MLDLFLLMAYVGGFCMLLGISEIIVLACMFLHYKSRKGKLNFKEYKKRYGF